MKRIELSEARRKWSKIVKEVKRAGTRVTLTKRGEPYADLVPHQPAKSQRPKREIVVNELHELSRNLPKSSFKQIKAGISEGRH